MYIVRLFTLPSVFWGSPILLLTLFLITDIYIQPAFAELTTIILPLHTILPQSSSPQSNLSPYKIAPVDSQGSASHDIWATAQSTTNTPTETIADSNSSQLATPPLKENQPASNAPKLKGRVTVPANPYRGVNNSSTPFAPEGTLRRGLPAPLDPVFPSTEYIGIASQLQIGIPDQDPMFPLEKAIYKACPFLAKNRIKFYGWVNPGV